MSRLMQKKGIVSINAILFIGAGKKYLNELQVAQFFIPSPQFNKFRI
jgi:hypothetical protein